MSIEFEGKKSVITPEGVFIIGTYDENGVPNAMNAAWGMQSDMGEITLMLSKHKTTENFEKTGAFTVAFGTADTVLISDYFVVGTDDEYAFRGDDGFPAFKFNAHNHTSLFFIPVRQSPEPTSYNRRFVPRCRYNSVCSYPMLRLLESC